ncbi:MAG: hypothetical protein AAGH78_15760 [Cyanobacteria bacterium P01_H01_bin.58]
MLPIVISEDLVSLFKYWQGDVRAGMLYRNELYTQLRTYNSESRLDAYEDGCRLSGAGWQVCITVAPSGYTLWKSLRAFPRNVNQNGLAGNIFVPDEVC